MARLRHVLILCAGFAIAREVPLQAYEPCYQICGPNVDCSQECEDYGTCGNYANYEGPEWCSTAACGNAYCDTDIETPESCPEDCGDPNGLDVVYPDDGNDYAAVTSPDSSRVDDCYGNCGAGCSSVFNICGGRHQYWELENVSGRVFDDLYLMTCRDSDLVQGVWPGSYADIRWTYNGYAADGCFDHDGRCPEWTWLGCGIWSGCGDGWDLEWAYDERVYWFNVYQATWYEVVYYNHPWC